jgi:hypothetical protein
MHAIKMVEEEEEKNRPTVITAGIHLVTEYCSA